MKKFSLLFLIVFLAIQIFFSSCDSKSNRAVQYSNSIVQEQKLVVALFDSLHKAMEEMNTSSIDKFYDKAVLQTGLAIEVVSKLKPFEEGDSSLKIQAVKLFCEYKSILTNEILSVTKEYKSNLIRYSSRKEDALRKIFSETDTKLTLALAEFQRIQKDFAMKHHFDIE